MNEEDKKRLRQEIVTQGEQATEILEKSKKSEAKLLYQFNSTLRTRAKRSYNQSGLSHNENSNTQNFWVRMIWVKWDC